MKIKALTLVATCISLIGFSQENVGIGTNNPNPQSVLDIVSQDKGVLIPRLTTISISLLGTSLSLIDNGMLVYDRDLLVFFYWDGTQWVQVGAGTGSDDQNLTGATLDGNNVLEIEIEDGNSAIVDLSSLQDGVDDADNNPANEIQNLSLNNDQLTITNNGNATTIDLRPYLDNTDNQTLSLSSNILSISNGNSVTLTDNVNDADSDPNNEIQILSKVGSTVTLSGGGGSLTDNDTQLSEAQVDSYVNNNGYLTSFTEVDGSTTNELQDISLSGTQLSISSGSTIDLNSLFPSGSVMSFNLSTCPAGWIKANGQNGTLDLRGEFIRGLDDGRGVDNGRTLVSNQGQSIQSHLHTVNPPATNTNNTGNHSHSVDPPNTNTTTNGNHSHFSGWYGPRGASGNARIFASNSPGDGAVNTGASGNHNHSVNISAFNSSSSGNHSHSVDISQFNSGSTGSSETRPRNVALLYCIKQ